MRSVKITRLPVGAQFVLLVGLALGIFGFAAPALAQPGPPGVNSATSGDQQLEVSWQAPTNVGAGIRGYEVRWKRISETAYLIASVSATTEEYIIMNLDSGETYDFQVRATDTNSQNSPWSFPQQATTLSAPDAPRAPRLSSGSSGTLNVAWNLPTNLGSTIFITEFDVRWRAGSSGSYTELNHRHSILSSAPSVTISNLINGQTYEVQVRARNAIGMSDWSPVATGSPSSTQPNTGTPDAPTGLTASFPSSRALNLSWGIPNDNGSAIIDYQLRWKLASEVSYPSANLVTSPLSSLSSGGVVDGGTLGNLRNTIAYDVQVRARNAVGYSAWSAELQSIPFGLPDAPPFTLSPGDGQIVVSWQAPADNGGWPIIGYRVEWQLASSGVSGVVDSSGVNFLLDRNDRSYTIQGLSNNMVYDVRVFAFNRLGLGGFSLDGSLNAQGTPVAAPVVAPAGSPERNARTTKRALQQVGGAFAAGAIDVLGGPVCGESGGQGGCTPLEAGRSQSSFTIAGMNLTPDTKARTELPVRTHADEAAPRHSFELSDLLQLGAFRVSLRHDGDEARGEGAPTAGDNWSIWGRGNVRGFASETDAGLELDGNAYAGWLGVDYTHSRSLMGGLAVSYDESRTDYTDPEFGGGEVSTRLGSFYPYLRISPTEALDLWGLMGFGWGSLDFSGEGQEDASTDMTIQVYALGAQLKIIDLYGALFSLKSDASFAVLKTASQANLPGIRTEPSRMRFALATQYPWEIDSVSKITPSVELGGRLDFNEVSGGAGVEVGGAVNYNHSTLRLNAEARARGLVYHNDSNVQDWGVSFQLRVDPNQFGQGLFASFAPHWGQSQSRVQRLWRDLDAPQGLAQDMSLQPHQMEAEFGYGFALPRMKATLSPFGRTRFAQTGAQTFSLGSRLQLGDMKLELTGEQQTAPLAPTDHRFSLHLSMPLGK